MSEAVIKRTNCHYCGYLCAFEATVQDGRVIDVKPDATRYPYSDTILAGCRRWKMNLPMLDASDRVNYPMRRVGERGSGVFERISWNTAVDEIAHKLSELRKTYGAQTLASAIGGPHTSFWPLHRFMNAFGSPNNMGIGQICWNPRIWMDVLTFGWTVEADIVPGVTDVAVIWGTNPAQSDNSAFWQAIRSLKKIGITLVCIDPRFTAVAGLADCYVPMQPGKDIWFALGLLHIIINENLIDEDFVDTWCSGYEELVEHVQEYTPNRCAKECGIDVSLLFEVAHLWGNAKAGVLVSGRGIDQVGPNVAPTHRAICCLRALRGFVDMPGTCILAEKSDFVPEVELERPELLSVEQQKCCLNTSFTPLQSYKGYELVNSLTMRFGNQLPKRYLTSAHPDLVLHAMETGEPYPIRALLVEATNPLLTYADTNRVFKALMNLDLIVVLDYFMTSTAQVADYVLPSAQAFERPLFQAHGGIANNCYGGPAAVEPYYERRCDYDIFKILGERLGQEDVWPDESFEEALRTTLAPTGMSYEEYCRTGMYYVQPKPFKYRQLDKESRERGFATATGRIELASEALDRLGGPRLPQPYEQISVCSGETLAKGVRLTMITGARKQPYNASMYFNNATFRKHSSKPCAEMSEETIRRLNLHEGDTVQLWSDFGTAKFILKAARMVDDVISVDYGWWHPESAIGAPGFGGIFESNINCLTSCSVTKGEQVIGTWSYNAIDCVISKSDEPIDELWPAHVEGLSITT